MRCSLAVLIGAASRESFIREGCVSRSAKRESPRPLSHARLQQLEDLIGPIAVSLGYELVRVRLSGSQRPVLQIMAERSDGGMDVDDCARLSRAISAAFEVDDPIESEYVLEVSSPGIDRPLVRRKDFEAYRGHEARIMLKSPLDGRKKFKGLLEGLEGENVLIRSETAVPGEDRLHSLSFHNIEDARLVLTDALIELDLKRRGGRAQASPQPEPEKTSHGRKRK